MLPNAQMPHKKHLWQIFHLIAWILKALVYTAYPLQRYLPRQFTPISGAKSLEIVRGLASTPHFWCVVAGILDCHWKSHAVARQLFRISSMWPSNPNSSQRRWSWVRPLDNLSWATFFSFHCGRDCRKNQREDCAKWTGKITVTIAVTFWRLVCSTILIWKLGFFVFN